MRQVVAPVISNTEVMPDTHLLWLQAPEITKVAQPGQFVMVRCGDSPDLLLRRPFSIHRVAHGGQIALLFNIVGRGTEWLSQCQKGDSLDLLGPLGKSFSLPSGSRRLLLVAGGIGIAPLVFLAEKGLNQGGSVTLLMGASNASLLYPRSLLPPSIDLVTATEDGSEGRRGMVTELISDFINQADQVFACGPASMYQSMAAQSCLKGRPVQISLEVRMGCGLGACYGCTIKTKKGLQQVCRDGPVFELADILW
jgi:dihydroorotate dehydrogenase electron transfer subunit